MFGSSRASSPSTSYSSRLSTRPPVSMGQGVHGEKVGGTSSTTQRVTGIPRTLVQHLPGRSVPLKVSVDRYLIREVLT